MLLGKLDSHMQKNQTLPLSYTRHKINSKWIDLKLKLLKENKGSKLLDIGLGDDFFKYLFIYLFLAAPGLHCCAPAFSNCGERGPLFVAWASHCSGFSCCGAQALGTQASVVVACGL